MSPESFSLAQAWLKKASSDLSAARILIEGDQKHFDIGSYHCQQAAEKALKGYLTAREILFPKTHSLEQLLDLATPSAGGFEQLRGHAKKLTPLVHEFRYPGDVSEPTSQEAEHALALAEEIYQFCEQQLGGVE